MSDENKTEDTNVTAFSPEQIAELREQFGIDDLREENQRLRDELNVQKGRTEAQTPAAEFGYSTPAEWEAHYQLQLAKAQAEQAQEQNIDEGVAVGTTERERLRRMETEYVPWAQEYNTHEENQRLRDRELDTMLAELGVDPESAEGKIARAGVKSGLSAKDVRESYFDKIAERETDEAGEAARAAAAAKNIQNSTIEDGEAQTALPGGGDKPKVLTRDEAMRKLTETARQNRRPATFAGLGFGRAAKEVAAN